MRRNSAGQMTQFQQIAREKKKRGTYRIKDTQDINQLQPMDGSYFGDN